MSDHADHADHVSFTVTVDWTRGEDPNIVIRGAGHSQSDRNAIAHVLREAADMIEADDAIIDLLT